MMSDGQKLRNCLITAEIGSSTLGKDRLFTSPALPVMAVEPLDSAPLMKVNKNTPVNRKAR
jgi:hypothetical protein